MSEKSEKQVNNYSPIFGYIFAILFGLAIGGVILLLNQRQKTEPIKIFPTSTHVPVLIHITGEIVNPGVYDMKDGQRISDVIEAAGGLTEKADTKEINLASTIHDGQKIFIPSSINGTANDEVVLSPSDVEQSGVEFPINLNYCSLEELIELPGIGQAKAEAIISYREQHGDFEVIEDIMNVSGIGPSIFENIKDKITVK